MNKKLKPYEKTEVAYKEILEGKKKAYDQKNAELRKQRLEKATKKTKKRTPTKQHTNTNPTNQQPNNPNDAARRNARSV